jgi:signal transduction histidine kinase
VIPEVPALRASRLSLYLIAASAISVAAVALVCALSLYSLRRFGGDMKHSLTAQITTLEQQAAFEHLLFQKGFVSEFLLTGDRQRLQKLEESRRAFAAWFSRAFVEIEGPVARALLSSLSAEYTAYDRTRGQLLHLADSGDTETEHVHELLRQNQARADRLLALCQQFGRLAHEEAQGTLAQLPQAMERRAWGLVGASLAATLASLVLGFLLARRVTRPIYALTLQVQSAVRRSHIAVSPGAAGIDDLGEQVGALLRKLEETDAAFVDQRRRLVQSEKLSALGELSAKLAHEILNPLAGMKAALQVLCRGGAPAAADVVETVAALQHEISRVEQLLRHLLHYVRPLQPDIAAVPIGRLLEQSLDATRAEIEAAGVRVRRTGDPGLLAQDVDVDPLLMTQALRNLLANAAQASPRGGVLSLGVHRVSYLGHDHLCIRVADQGPGISPENRGRLFRPFFTTKQAGHGLGLATSQNIVMEHGGQIVLREPAPEEGQGPGQGAIFDVLLPLPDKTTR